MKRLLVISNACFSNIDSNGRTLAKLFANYPKEKLAQFCVYGSPDFSVCNSFYKVTDKNALKSALTLRPHGGVLREAELKDAPVVPYRGSGNMKKQPVNHLIRELVWATNLWRGKEFWKWLSDFKPEMICLFLGNSTFLVNLTTKIAKAYNIPVVIYSTEDYYFKDYNYLSRRPSLFYALLRAGYVRACKRLDKHVTRGLLSTPKLAERYEAAFSFPCDTFFTKSDIDFVEHPEVPQDGYRISYLGNLALNRHKPLMEIADAVEILPGTKLDVYGKCPPEAEEEFLKNPNINFRGFVSYADVVKTIHESNLLVHAEYNDPFYLKDLQAAFSTKIADSVCSGTPFFIYADASLAETDFLMREGCAFVATTREELKSVLKKALLDEQARYDTVQKAEHGINISLQVMESCRILLNHYSIK